MKRRVAAAAMSTALLVGCSSPEQAGPSVPPAAISGNAFSSQGAQLTREVFQDTRAYWAARGVGSMATLRLVLLERNKTAWCIGATGLADELTPLSLDRYCPGNNTVVATSEMDNAISSAGGSSAIKAFNIAHEVGHAVESSLNSKLLTHTDNTKALQTAERKATMYAGEYMAGTYDAAALQQVAEFICKTPMDIDHGSSAQQAEAFARGVSQADPQLRLSGC